MRAERIFYNWVDFLEVEISSACNRKCGYCPRSVVERKRELMPIEVFKKIMTQLKTIDFDRALAFHQYNEPLLELDHLLECINIAREYIPKARLELYTNGDFLDKELHRKLQKCGINEFHISCQLNPGEVWSEELAMNKINAMRNKIGVFDGIFENSDGRVFFKPESQKELEYGCISRGLIKDKEYPCLTYIDSNDYYRNGSTRLDIVKKVDKIKEAEEDRSWFCPSMLHSMHVSYRGNAYLCWDCCDGAEEAKDFYLGSIFEESIFELYKNKQKFLVDYIYGKEPKQCINCRWNRCK